MHLRLQFGLLGVAGTCHTMGWGMFLVRLWEVLDNAYDQVLNGPFQWRKSFGDEFRAGALLQSCATKDYSRRCLVTRECADGDQGSGHLTRHHRHTARCDSLCSGSMHSTWIDQSNMATFLSFLSTPETSHPAQTPSRPSTSRVATIVCTMPLCASALAPRARPRLWL